MGNSNLEMMEYLEILVAYILVGTVVVGLVYSFHKNDEPQIQEYLSLLIAVVIWPTIFLMACKKSDQERNNHDR